MSKRDQAPAPEDIVDAEWWEDGAPPTSEGKPKLSIEEKPPVPTPKEQLAQMHGERFRDPNGRIVGPTGEVDKNGHFIVEVETDDGTEETTVSPQEILHYTKLDDSEPDKADSVNESQSSQSNSANNDTKDKEGSKAPAPQAPKDDEETKAPEHTPRFSASRKNLREIVENYTKADRPSQQDIASLEDLEKMALDDLKSVDTKVVRHLDGMRESGLSDEKVNEIQDYLYQLRMAATGKQGGIDNPEIKQFFEEDLTEKRTKLAEQTHARINSFWGLKGKKEHAAAQAEYDESLRALGRWQLTGVDDEEERQKEATFLAFDEVQNLRIAVNEIEEPTQEKSWFGKLRDRVLDYEFTYERKFGKKKGQERTIALGRIGLAMATSTGVSGLTGAANLAGLGVAVGTGAVVGAATGAVVSGYRAHKEIKGELADRSEEEEKKELALEIVQGDTLDVDKVVGAHMATETNKARKERLGKIRKRMARGALRSALIGAGSGLLVGGVGLAFDQIGSEASAASESSSSAEVDSQPEGEIDEPVAGEEEVGAETPTAEDLLQHYAGENAEAATTIELGEGPYNTLEEMGIPQEKWDELYHNDELTNSLVDKGYAYSLSAEGIQDHGWGWLGNELPDDAVVEIYEAAGMTTPEALPVAEVDLPSAYADLPPDVQEFAQDNPIVADVPRGMGGEAMMQKMGLDKSAWYAIEDSLLKGAPGDFYRMSDGHVGLSHTGALSADGLAEIYKRLNQQGVLR